MTWLVLVTKRIGDLVVKLISLKVLIAAVLTALLYRRPELANSFGFVIIAVMWIVVFGLRDFIKGKQIIAGITPGATVVGK